MSDPLKYTVGWICAISTEQVAARVFLDKEHKAVQSVAANDSNSYVLGEVGKHNVVIAVLPDGEYGTDSAASVAVSMLNSFPNIRIGLMVGIGGGVPTRQDIRLGDVVVSSPRDGHGGVFQFDYGKTIQDQRFQHTRFLNQPPSVLRAALSTLKAQYEIHGHGIEVAVKDIVAKKPRLRKRYSRPDPTSDKLFNNNVTHKSACGAICTQDLTKLKQRPERAEDDENPVIHYGLIASGNQLMKDALIRDRLAAEQNVLCFEMEAAGLMNNFPCLVIRGICDYSDSHKSKEWQGYAAMVAAAYAKDLLYQIQPTVVEHEQKIANDLSGIQKNTEKLLQIHEASSQGEKVNEEQACHQLFRLKGSGGGAPYEWYKGQVKQRVQGTCMWLLKHDHYQEWLNRESGPLLVTADPGCGKSVLAKYLIDHALPRSATICYFFFKDQDQNTVRQALCALLHQLFSQEPYLIKHAMKQYRNNGEKLTDSTISLWRILHDATKDAQARPVIIVLDALDECAESEFRSLICSVEERFRDGERPGDRLKYLLTCRPYEQIVSRFHALLRAFPNIRIPGEQESETISQEVNCVIDSRLGQLSEEKGCSPEIMSYLKKRMRECSHRTYLWVYLVFDYLENESFKKTQKGVESTIARLPKSVNEAYEQILAKSKNDPMVRKALSIVLAASRPLTVSEMNIAVNVNEQSRSVHSLDLEQQKDFETRLRTWCGLFISIHHDKIYFLHQTAREFLVNLSSPVAAAVCDLNSTWHHSITPKQAHLVLAEICVLYLDLFNNDEAENCEDYSYCADTDDDQNSQNNYGLLVYSANTWFFHFYEADIDGYNTIIHTALRICDPALKSYSNWYRLLRDDPEWYTYKEPPAPPTALTLASSYGLRSVVKLLLSMAVEVNIRDGGHGRTPLACAVLNGHEAVVKLLLAHKDVDPNLVDYSKQTPLCIAMKNGNEAIARLLLVDDRIDVNAKFNPDGPTHPHYRSTIQFLVKSKGRGMLAKTRIKLNAINVSIQDHSERGNYETDYQGTTGSNAIEKHHIGLLYGALCRTRDCYNDGVNPRDDSRYWSGTPLFVAIALGHTTIVKCLLNKSNVDISSGGSTVNYYATPLFVAAAQGDEEVVKQLLAKTRININEKGWAAGEDHEQVYCFHKVVYQGTPLSVAAWRGHKATVKLLLGRGKADVNAIFLIGQQPFIDYKPGYLEDATYRVPIFQDTPSQGTPLFCAAAKGYEEIMRLLLDQKTVHLNFEGCIVDEYSKHCLSGEVVRQSYKGTPLSIAAWKGHKTIIKILLAQEGVDVNARAHVEYESKTPYQGAHLFEIYSHATPLGLAAAEEHEDISALLLATKRVEIDAKDQDGRTPLWWATLRCNKAIVELLLKHGANIQAEDNSGATPLSHATQEGYEEIVELLLKYKVDVNIETGEYKNKGILSGKWFISLSKAIF